MRMRRIRNINTPRYLFVTNMRPWLKTGTYAAMHLLVAMAVAFAISGSWRVALGIGIVEPAV